jgi:hypothetical protein
VCGWLIEAPQIAAQILTLGIVLGMSFKLNRVRVRRVIDQNDRVRED